MGDLENYRLCNLRYCYQRYTDTSEVLKQDPTVHICNSFSSSCQKHAQKFLNYVNNQINLIYPAHVSAKQSLSFVITSL